jgi:hypothetical protein
MGVQERALEGPIPGRHVGVPVVATGDEDIVKRFGLPVGQRYLPPVSIDRVQLTDFCMEADEVVQPEASGVCSKVSQQEVMSRVFGVVVRHGKVFVGRHTFRRDGAEASVRAGMARRRRIQPVAADVGIFLVNDEMPEAHLK